MREKEKLQKIEERMLFLKSVMQDDGRAMKCFKMNVSFAELYPDDYQKYVDANKEYNSLEKERDELRAKIKEDEARIPQ